MGSVLGALASLLVSLSGLLIKLVLLILAIGFFQPLWPNGLVDRLEENDGGETRKTRF